MDRWSNLKQEIAIFSSHGALLFYGQNFHQFNVQNEVYQQFEFEFYLNSNLVYQTSWYRSNYYPKKVTNLTFRALALWRRAKARNVSFVAFLRWSFDLINSFDIPNFRVSLSHRRRTTVSLEIKPFYLYSAQFKNLNLLSNCDFFNSTVYSYLLVQYNRVRQTILGIVQIVKEKVSPCTKLLWSLRNDYCYGDENVASKYTTIFELPWTANIFRVVTRFKKHSSSCSQTVACFDWTEYAESLNMSSFDSSAPMFLQVNAGFGRGGLFTELGFRVGFSS